MPRTARAIAAGYCYHLINRSNGRARLFHDCTDYTYFLSLVATAQQRVALPLLAACLMPNHLHLVVRPHQADDVARWTHWVFTTHVRHYHAHYGSSGRLWQGRYKAFPIQQDGHLLTVMRYVERNALRAGLVEHAQDWRWGSLHWRTGGYAGVPLAAPPVPLPDNWTERVNEAQTAVELDALRTCVNRQRPFGERGWAERTAEALELTPSLAPIGRPRRR